jgi:hypothetical protein
MCEDVATALRSGSEQFAEAIQLAPAELIRARGSRRRRRAAAGSAALCALAVAGIVIGYLALARPGASPPATRSGPLQLVAPRVYVQGMPSQIAFVIPATGQPATVTVHVDLGHPSSAIYLKPVVQRAGPVTGQWTQVPVTYQNGDLACSYRLRVQGWATQQRLVVVAAEPAAFPPAGAGRVRVRVLSGHKLLGAQSGPRAVFRPSMTITLAPRGSLPSIPMGGSRQFTATFRNPLNVRFRMRLNVLAGLCHGSCPAGQTPPGLRVQWLDGVTWRDLGPVAFRAGSGQFTENLSLRPLGRTVFRLRVLAGPGSSSDLGVMILDAMPDVASFPGQAHLYNERRPLRYQYHWPIIMVGRK